MAELVYPPVIGTARGVFRALDIRFDVAGTHHVPTSGGAVLASNHVSYLDFIFAGLTAQPSKRLVRFMAKDSVFRHPVSGPLMRGMHHIPVNRDAGAAAYVAGLKALRAGEIIGVFPEATISQSFVLKEFKTGATRMAAAAGVPIVPVIVWGGQRLWTKGRPKTLTTRHLPLVLRVGEPLHPQRSDDHVAVTKELHERMDDLLEDALDAYAEPPTDPAAAWWWPARRGGGAPPSAAADVLDE